MFRLASLYVDIVGKDDKFTSALDRAHSTAIRRGAMIGSVLGNALSGTLGMALQAVGGAFTGTVGAASGMNDTLAKTGTIFGDSAGKIIGQADEMAAKFGVAKQEFLGAATNFGAVFKGAGKSQAEAAGLGTELAKLGMDMARFSGATNEDAFGAISSALRGEFDPIEKYGVFLNAAAIEQQAVAMGAEKTANGISELAKKTAAMALIQNQAADALGATERYAGTFSGTISRLMGNLANFGSSVGAAIMPAFQALAGQGERLLGALSSGFATLAPYVQTASGWIGAAITKMGDVVATVVGLYQSAFAALMATPAFQWLASGFQAASGAVQSASGLIGDAVTFIGEAAASAGEMFSLMANDFMSTPVFAWLSEQLTWVGEKVAEGMTWAGEWLTYFKDQAVGALGVVAVMFRNQGIVYEMVKLRLQTFVQNAVIGFHAVVQNAGILASWLAGNWRSLIADAANGVVTIFKNLVKNITGLWSATLKFLGGGGWTFNYTPMLQGMKEMTSKLPEMVRPMWVDASDQMGKLGDQMADREVKRQVAIGAAKPEAGAQPMKEYEKAPAMARAAAAAGDQFKTQSFAASDFARQLQGQQFGKDAVATKQLKVLEENRDELKKLNEKKAGAGLGALAVYA